MEDTRGVDLAALRQFLQEMGLDEQDRQEWEALVEAAEQGDELALLQVHALAATRGYEPPPGEDEPVSPGQKMVCPKDPKHYSDFRQAADEELYCPEHVVKLVPEGEV
jgi:hypothetical protein